MADVKQTHKAWRLAFKPRSIPAPAHLPSSLRAAFDGRRTERVHHLGALPRAVLQASEAAEPEWGTVLDVSEDGLGVVVPKRLAAVGAPVSVSLQLRSGGPIYRRAAQVRSVCPLDDATVRVGLRFDKDPVPNGFIDDVAQLMVRPRATA